MSFFKFVEEERLAFTSEAVDLITGTKRTRRQQWHERGWIPEPSIQVAEGHGTRNIYSIYDLYRIALFRTLIEDGIHRKLAADVVKNTDIDAVFAKVIYNFGAIKEAVKDRVSEYIEMTHDR